MKKLITLMCLTVLIYSCKDTKTEATTEVKTDVATDVATETPQAINSVADKPAEVDCENDETYKEIKNLSYTQFLAWVRIPANSQKICEAGIYNCIEKTHVIRRDDFTAMRRPASDGTEYFPVKWSEIQKFATAEGVNCYEKHLHFVVVDKKVVISAIDFTSLKSCYSLPFLTGVKELTKLADPEFEFTYTNKPKEFVFRIKNDLGDYMYYDISDNPKSMVHFK